MQTRNCTSPELKNQSMGQVMNYAFLFPAIFTLALESIESDFDRHMKNALKSGNGG